MKRRLRFMLHIPADEYLAYYRGEAHSVVARTHDGQRVQFPADKLRPFVSHDGVHGHFEMIVDERQHFVSLRRVRP